MFQNLAMVHEYRDNPCDVLKKKVFNLKEQVVNISHNVATLMEILDKQIGPFRDFGGSKK